MQRSIRLVLWRKRRPLLNESTWHTIVACSPSSSIRGTEPRTLKLTNAYDKFPHAIANNGQHSSTIVLPCAKVLQAPYKELLQLKELPMRNESTYSTLDYFLLPKLHSPAHSIRIHVIDICIFRCIIFMVKIHQDHYTFKRR